MLMTTYNQLLIMSIVAGGLYLLLKLLSVLTLRYFTAAWHYYSNLIIYSFFLVPYYKIGSLFHVDLGTIAPNGLGLPSLMELSQPTVINPTANTALMLQTKAYAGTLLYFVPYILMAGTLIFLAAAWIQGYRLQRHMLSACNITTEEQILGTLLKCKQELGITRELPVYISARISTPFLYGNFRPRIVLPDIKFTSEELRYIFLHELAHWKRRDAWLKGLLLFINALHWFNPLADLAHRDIDRFCELSCDESVVKSMNSQERREYCELILSVAGNVADQKNRLASVFAFNNKRNLERRIGMILKSEGLKNKKSVRMMAIAMTLAILLLGMSAATYAANEKPATGNQVEVLPATSGGYQLIDGNVYDLDGNLLIKMHDGFTPDGYTLDPKFTVYDASTQVPEDQTSLPALDIFRGTKYLTLITDDNQGVQLGGDFTVSPNEPNVRFTYGSGIPSGVNFELDDVTRGTIVVWASNFLPGKSSPNIPVYNGPNGSDPSDVYRAKASAQGCAGNATVEVAKRG